VPPEIPRLKKYQVYIVILIAAIGFLFDTYELLMFPVIGSDAVADLLSTPDQKVLPGSEIVKTWAGRMLWIAALCGGTFGLLGGWLIDKLGRRTVMAASIILYSFSPVLASFSTELWHLVLFRSLTFIGVCVEMVAAVTWLAELFADKRTREKVIAWTLACASLGGILVTEVYNHIVDTHRTHQLAVAKAIEAGETPPAHPYPAIPLPDRFEQHVPWRYTLLTGLVPGALILFLLPFVPESYVWREKKRNGTLQRPSFGKLFQGGLTRTTIVTTILSACGYAAAFGALQLTPLQIIGGRAELAPINKDVKELEEKLKAAPDKSPEAKAIAGELRKKQQELRIETSKLRGNIQRWQELGGLTGRILLAILVGLLASGPLLRVFLIPGVILFPLTYLVLIHESYNMFAIAIFLCGLLTVAQFSYLSEFLPKVFPLHLRGTGSSFATNVGGRMIGTMAATFNTELLSGYFSGPTPIKVATAAAVIGGSVFFIALVASFFLPKPETEPTT
jgi:MFS family permease